MINPRELRIGNLVLKNEQVSIVTCVNIDYCICHGLESKKLLYSNINCDFDPIQLTEEWLLKFVFEIKDGRFGNSYHFNNFHLWTSKEKTICFVLDDEFIFDVKSVHELQNLYFALTNQELCL